VIPKTSFTQKVATIYAADLPENIQTGEPIPLKITLYSTVVNTQTLVIKIDGKIASTSRLKLHQGLVEVKPSLVLADKGYHLIEFSLEGSTAVRKLIYCLPEFYHIVIIAGRPSEELSFLKHFLDKLRWIQVDVKLLSRKLDTALIPEASRYNGLILMDLEDNQLKNAGQLASYSRPVIYQPGIHPFQKVRGLWSAFTKEIPLESFGERKILWNGQELIVNSAYDSDQLTMDYPNRKRIITGWDTWKWDFSRTAEGINYNDHETFWQNNLNFLLSGEATALPPQLNYFTGEENPAGQKIPGLYQVKTNGNEMKILIADNPAENPAIGAGFETAKLVSTNAVWFEDIKDWKSYVDKLRSTDKSFKVIPVRIDFQHNVVIFLCMVFFLVISWFFQDRKTVRD
jgi:hypothetical protein